MSSAGKDFEYKGQNYLIQPMDARTGSRIAYLYLRGLANLPEADFEWVQNRALQCVSRYDERDTPMPIFHSGRIVPEDLRNEPSTIMALVDRVLNWMVLDDFFASNGIELLVPDAVKRKAAEEAEKTSQ